METLSQPLTADPAEYRQQMMQRLDTLRRNERFGDVTVVVQGTEFTAHKVVLSAASPFLFKLLDSNMKESTEERIEVTLKEATMSVMEDVLEYIYTGNVTVTEESFPHNLIATADYLLMPSLKTLSGRFLQQKLDIENCICTYNFAVKYHCEELMAKSLEFINANFTAVMATERFLSLNSKQVTELISSDDIIVNTEEEVFKAILNWVSQNMSERKGEFAGLFRQIRLMSLSRDYLFNEMIKEELVKHNNECLNFVLEAVKWIPNVVEEDGTRPTRKCPETHTDAILACGGRKMLCYLPDQKRWYELADSLFEHVNHSVAQYRDRVYIVGGEKNVADAPRRLLEYYLSSRNIWAAVQTHQFYMEFSSFTVLKGYLYATSNSFRETGVVSKYDPENNYWQDLSDQLTRRGGVCGVSDGKHLYLMGGGDHFNAVATTERFDPDGNKWEEVAPMNGKRKNAFGAAANEKIYVAGGTHQWRNNKLASCEVYNPVTNDWQLIASLQVPRGSGSMVCFKGALYVLGGSNEESRELSVEAYDPGRNDWRKETDIPNAINCETAFKGCLARISKGVISRLQPLENSK